MKILVNTIAIILLLSTGIFAQISKGGIPPSFQKIKSITKDTPIPVVEMPFVNVEKLLLEDAINNKGKRLKPFRYAKVISVDLNINNSGTWKIMPDGSKIWQLGIYSSNAYSLGITFGEYDLPPGATLFVYNKDKTHILGAFTSNNNKTSGILPISPVKGDEIIVEYYIPAKTKVIGKVRINKVMHDYRNIFKHLNTLKTAGACNIDINCAEGNDWQDEKRAVCKILFNGGACSGAIINNTNNDEVPYFLTANHCIDDESDAQSITFIFNYEHTVCDGTEVPATQSLAGATLVATAPNGSLDFSLVKMSSLPPSSYQAYYTGWNKKTEAASEGTCIHHPSGDVKKISVEEDNLITGNFGSGYDSNSHWHVEDWEVGTTEQGSSGSPLFDQNHQIIGDLTGGEADCNDPVNDFYAKFSRSWEDYSPIDQQLKYWLDPYSTGVDTLSGHDPNIADGDKNAQLLSIISPLDSNFNISNISPKVVFKNKGNENLTNLDVSYQIDEGSIVTEPWTGNLAFNETDTITFTNIAITGGDHSFKTYCSSPNSGSDTNPYNDTLNLDFFVSYNLDAQVISINNPKDEYCNENTITPQVTIRNLGNTTLTSVTVYYQIDEGAFVSQIWSGSLTQLNTTNVSFSDTTIANGDHTLKAYVSNPNGSSDMNTSNDTLEKNFIIITGEEVRLMLTTDDYGSETSWILENSLSEILYTGSNYSDNIAIVENFCLENDCYDFTILDSESDGICCDYGYGEYILARVNEDTSLDTIVKGGEFESQENTEFCVPVIFANFTADATSILEGEDIQFTDLSYSDNTITSYSWIFEGGTPSSSTNQNPIVTYNNDGIYDVTLTISDGTNNLTELKSNYITVSLPDAIEETTETEKYIKVYPIPSHNGLIRIESDIETITSCSVFNLLGQKFELEIDQGNNVTLNLSHLNEGIYILKIQTNKGEFVRKIILTKYIRG